jgi:hypothetical protein
MTSQNGSAVEQKQSPVVEELSVQKRTEDSINSGMFWFSRDLDGSEISPWWSEQRDKDLIQFTMKEGNDILQGAISSMVKKFRAMNWALSGPEKTIARYQRVLAESDFGQGWEVLIGKTVETYLRQDKGTVLELIGSGDPSTPLVSPVLGVATLDSQFCQLTGDLTFPVIFHNAKGNTSHKIHATRMVHIVDMPSPNELMNNIGFCAVSRVIASSSVLLKLARYKNEKLDDLPEAGLLIFNNILPDKWDDARANYQRQRRRLGQQFWANVMTFFSLDPAQAASADFINFSNLPDNFNEKESIDTYINILSLAFGVDVREFWPMSAGPLGTAQETTVQAQKAKGKGIGDIISTIERAINWSILPRSVTFAFDFQDDEEDKLRAEIEDIKTNTIMSMWRPDAITGSPVTSMEIRQMLADNVDYFKDDFLVTDITEEESVDDMSKALGPIVSIDSKGNISRSRKKTKIREYVNKALAYADENYRSGYITAEEIAEFTLSQLVE